MLATKPSRNAAEYKALLTEDTEAGEGIFSGLTFPEVPTDAPKIPQFPVISSFGNSKNDDYVELASSDADADVPTHKLRVPVSFKWQRSTKPLPIATEVGSDEVPNDSTKQHNLTVPATTSQSLPDYSSLYFDPQTKDDIEDTDTASLYPSISECDSKQEEKVSTTISDLIHEIQTLRQNLSHQLEPELSSVAVCQVNGRGSSTHRQWLSSQEMRQISPMMTSAHEEQFRRLHNYEDELESMLTKTKTEVKYICCGSCRKWMKSDANANLVRCPNSACLAVNNLSLAPLNASTIQQPAVNSSQITREVHEEDISETRSRNQPKQEPPSTIFNWLCISCYEDNDYEL